jgi:mono/diheme cytochrome c family protein
MSHRIVRTALAAMFASVLAASILGASAAAADPQIERGKYLVLISGCSDCHTPGTFLGHPDMTRFLGGSDVGFAIPGLGVFTGPNLTSDKETGLGKWTAQQIVAAVTTGTRPDGRILAPSMPWRGFANLTPSDAMAVAAYLQSLPPVSHKVPGPFGPTETPDVFVMSVQPGPVYASQNPK